MADMRGRTQADRDYLVANQAASKFAEEYRGRRGARAKGEMRRKEILSAALRIVARDGVRAVKHRSVAREADVPLAATTYYFRDIDELLNDAFILFSEEAGEQVRAFYDTLQVLLDSLSPEMRLRTSPERPQLAKRLASVATAYLETQFRDRKAYLLAEQAFLIEALRDDRLSRLARRYRKSWVSGLAELLEKLDSPSATQDASLIVHVVLGMGYDLMLGVPGDDDGTLARAVERIVDLALGVGDR